MADRYNTLSSGKEVNREATVVSTGVGEAGDIVALDGTGKLDPSVLPVGVGPDVKVLEATEALSAGDYVNIFDDLGTEKVRLADNSNNRPAHGWVDDAVIIGANATVFFEGPNSNLAGLTIGARYYLGTAGAASSTPIDPAVAASGTLHQLLGTAISATSINTDIDDCVQVE